MLALFFYESSFIFLAFGVPNLDVNRGEKLAHRRDQRKIAIPYSRQGNHREAELRHLIFLGCHPNFLNDTNGGLQIRFIDQLGG